MANLGAILLSLSLVSFVSAGFMLWSALVQKLLQKRVSLVQELLQIFVCGIFFLLEIALITLSTLLLHWKPGESLNLKQCITRR